MVLQIADTVCLKEGSRPPVSDDGFFTVADADRHRGLGVHVRKHSLTVAATWDGGDFTVKLYSDGTWEEL